MHTATAQREAIRTGLDANVERARTLAAVAGSGRWTSRPAPGAWSASDCVQHLIATAEAFVPRFEAAIADARPTVDPSDAPYRLGLISRLFIWSLEPPYRLRMKTSARFIPSTPRPPADDLDALADCHRRLLAQMDRAATMGLRLDRLAVASPFAERMRYAIYTSLRIIDTHERRHLWQAEQTLARVAG